MNKDVESIGYACNKLQRDGYEALGTNDNGNAKGVYTLRFLIASNRIQDFISTIHRAMRDCGYNVTHVEFMPHFRFPHEGLAYVTIA